MRTTRFFREFFKNEAAGGVCLFAAALFAILLANIPGAREAREAFLHAPVGASVGGWSGKLSVAHWINDGLMAVFFFLVGMEIKRELLRGELASPARAMLPGVAAAGGMFVPALIYFAFNHDDSIALRGWAIPAATDIAFSLGVLSLLGSRAPVSLKVFLTAVAVMDDLGAIAIIAIFYTSKLHFGALAGAAAAAAVLFFVNRRGITKRAPYFLLGLVLWGLMLKSGVHATIAGVVLAFTIPLRTGDAAGESPLERLEHDLHGAVVFAILPVFAFANAGVNFSGMTAGQMFSPIPMGIACGLFFGKIIGIFCTTALAVKCGLGELPGGGHRPLLCVAMLCGIGFTVSLFIGDLAFAAIGDTSLSNVVTLGVLMGSTISGIAGYLALRYWAYPGPARG